MLNKTMFMAGGNTDEQKDYYSLGFKSGYAAAPQKGMKDEPTLTIQQALEVWESALDWDYNMKEKHDYKRTYFLEKFGVDIDKTVK